MHPNPTHPIPHNCPLPLQPLSPNRVKLELKQSRCASCMCHTLHTLLLTHLYLHMLIALSHRFCFKASGFCYTLYNESSLGFLLDIPFFALCHEILQPWLFHML